MDKPKWFYKALIVAIAACGMLFVSNLAPGLADDRQAAQVAENALTQEFFDELRASIPFDVPEEFRTQPWSVSISPFSAAVIGDEITSARAPRQNPERFIKEERMLAYGWLNPDAYDFWDLSNEERRVWREENRDLPGAPWLCSAFRPAQDTAELWWKVRMKLGRDPHSMAELLNNADFAPVFYDEECKFHDYIDELLNEHTSPITGKLIEFNHPEFSPGNMWITVVLKPLAQQFRESLRKGRDDAESMPVALADDAVYVFYRAYGRTGIIREGLLLKREDGSGFGWS